MTSMGVFFFFFFESSGALCLLCAAVSHLWTGHLVPTGPDSMHVHVQSVFVKSVWRKKALTPKKTLLKKQTNPKIKHCKIG